MVRALEILFTVKGGVGQEQLLLSGAVDLVSILKSDLVENVMVAVITVFVLAMGTVFFITPVVIMAAIGVFYLIRTLFRMIHARLTAGGSTEAEEPSQTPAQMLMTQNSVQRRRTPRYLRKESLHAETGDKYRPARPSTLQSITMQCSSDSDTSGYDTNISDMDRTGPVSSPLAGRRTRSGRDPTQSDGDPGDSDSGDSGAVDLGSTESSDSDDPVDPGRGARRMVLSPEGPKVTIVRPDLSPEGDAPVVTQIDEIRSRGRSRSASRSSDDCGTGDGDFGRPEFDAVKAELAV